MHMLIKESWVKSVEESIDEQIPLCISLGATCNSAIYLKELGLRHEAYPFDWMTSPFNALCQAINDDFLYFLTDLKLSPNNNGIFDRYGFFFTHDWPTTQDANIQNDFVHGTCLVPDWEENTAFVKKKYLRRIERFKNACLGKEKILFLRTEFVTKKESILLKDLIQLKWPKLDFILVVIANHLEFQDQWGIEKIINFYDYSQELASIRKESIKSRLMLVIKENGFFKKDSRLK